MKLVAAIRTAQTPPIPSILLRSTPAIITSRATSSSVRFSRHNQSQPDDKPLADSQEMDHDKDKDKETMLRNPNQATGDVMSHSFGEGYATRSDEEGFGGIYGGNDSTTDPNTQPFQPVIHENHPEYDRSQGSHVSEKEKARNQEKVDH